MKKKHTHTKQEDKRCLESGQRGDTIDVESFCRLVRLIISTGLPRSFFDNKEVHKTVRMTTECEENYIRTNCRV